MWTIARMTFQEMFRKKLFYLTAVLTAGFLLLYGAGIHYAYQGGPQDPFSRTLMGTQLLAAGLYFANFMVAFMAFLGAVGTISAEIENGTMHAIVPKPIRRRDIVLGKFLGLGAMLAAYAVVVFFLILIMHRGRVPIPWPNQGQAAAFFVLGPLVLLALTTLGSAAMLTLQNGVTMVVLFGLGMVGGFMEQLGRLMDRPALQNIGIVSSLLVPADAMYRKMSFVLLTAGGGRVNFGMVSPFGAASEPSAAMVAYTLLYLAAALWLAIRVFERRDI